MALRSGHDWFYPYYRDRALCLTLGVTPHEMLQQAVGAAADPASGGRQMPSHWGHRKYHIVSSSSPTGTQFLQAVGCAEASRYQDPKSDEVTLVCAGEGATSEGEFWEALNMASLARLPVLFLIEDNGYAITVPIEAQTAGGSISALTAGFPGLFRQEVDGTDFFASYRAMREAVAVLPRGTRSGAGACARDPALFAFALRRRAAVPDGGRARGRERARPGAAVSQTADRRRRDGPADAAEHHARNRRRGPAGHPAGDARRSAGGGVRADSISIRTRWTRPPSSSPSEPHFHGAPMTMVDLINAALREEMRRNPDILVFGEDVADCTREASLSEVKGKGGVFKVTHGLQTEFGSRRVFNTPLAEAAIVGRAIGMATRGLKPVAEIQFFDYIWPAMMQIRDELATMRWRSNGNFSCPAVIRVPIGGYLNGGAIYHSQCGESTFTHIPGLRVVLP